MEVSIPSLDYIRSAGSEEQAIERLVNEAHNNTMSFPYRSIFCESADVYFKRLREYTPTIDTNRYRMFGYSGKHKLFLPPFFQGNPLVIVGSDADLDDIEALPDLFLEDIRVRGCRKGHPSSLEVWRRPELCRPVIARALRLSKVTSKWLRTAIEVHTKEPRTFRCTWIKSIFEILIGQQQHIASSSSYWSTPLLVHPRILDLSPGWGECLLATLALECTYTGYSDHISCQRGYSGMITMFGNPTYAHMNYAPFEKSNDLGQYDIVYFRPNIFDEELFIDDNNQPYKRYPSYEDWLVSYVFGCLIKAWNQLVENGFLVLALSDSKQYAPCEAINLFIEQFLKGSSYEGIIGVVGDDKKPHPVWIWKKTNEITRKIWSPPVSKHAFVAHYPELVSRVLSLQLSQKDQALEIERSNITKNVNSVFNRLQELHPAYIRSAVLEIIPETMIRDIVHKHGFEDSIPLLENMLQPWFPDVSCSTSGTSP